MTQRLIQKVFGCIYSGLVSPLAGTPDTAISHAVFRYGQRGSVRVKPYNQVETVRGHGSIANHARLSQIRDLGYSSVMCMVCSKNLKQITIMKNNGWIAGPPMYSYRTENYTIPYFKQL